MIKATSKCPICGAPTEIAYKPFCSKRCADIDLHRWLNASYGIAAMEDDSDGFSEELPQGGEE
ncbi:MAG: DNA gyrase inhibitor YacG [Pseudomonadota bacterium]